MSVEARVYRAVQADTTRCRAWVEVDGRRRALRETRWSPASRRYVLRSNGGYSYGYNGTGPTNLARAILADALGLPALNADPDARALVVDFRVAFVGLADQAEPLDIPAQDVLSFVAGWRAARSLAQEDRGDVV